jgi:hypothetical protein
LFENFHGPLTFYIPSRYGQRILGHSYSRVSILPLLPASQRLHISPQIAIGDVRANQSVKQASPCPSLVRFIVSQLRRLRRYVALKDCQLWAPISNPNANFYSHGIRKRYDWPVRQLGPFATRHHGASCWSRPCVLPSAHKGAWSCQRGPRGSSKSSSR